MFFKGMVSFIYILTQLNVMSILSVKKTYNDHTVRNKTKIKQRSRNEKKYSKQKSSPHCEFYRLLIEEAKFTENLS